MTAVAGTFYFHSLMYSCARNQMMENLPRKEIYFILNTSLILTLFSLLSAMITNLEFGVLGVLFMWNLSIVY